MSPREGKADRDFGDITLGKWWRHLHYEASKRRVPRLTGDHSRAMVYQTKVKLYVADAPSEWIPCAIVCLYDRDRISRDDHLGMDITDVYGEATFQFSESDFVDLDDRLGGALPELYVKVFDSEGRCVVSTRTGAARNSVPDLIRIPIERKLALSHHLI